MLVNMDNNIIITKLVKRLAHIPFVLTKHFS